MYKTLLKNAESYISSLYKDDEKNNLLYHNFEHAATVVRRINEIAAHYQLTDEETVSLNLAGWFHDTGHLYSQPTEHEEESVKVAEKWMKENEVDNTITENVKALITATKLLHNPTTLTEKIIKDADTYHLGTKEFKKTDKLLKEEMRLRNYTTKLAAWNENSLEVLEQHEYYTEYCQRLLTHGKQKNIEKLKNKAIEQNYENAGTSMILDEKSNNKDAAKQNSFITKGIQTMLRLTSENHMELSSLADSKANILISVNAIIISLILSILIRKIEVDTHLTIPTLIFLATAVSTIVLAIIATRPKVTSGRFNRDQVIHGKTNLLFFGNFHKTTLDEYKWGMSMMMRDPNYLYGGLVDDIYHLGVVLGRKYKMLSIAYSIFMIGILVSVLAFIAAILFHQPPVTGEMEINSGSPF